MRASWVKSEGARGAGGRAGGMSDEVEVVPGRDSGDCARRSGGRKRPNHQHGNNTKEKGRRAVGLAMPREIAGRNTTLHRQHGRTGFRGKRGSYLASEQGLRVTRVVLACEDVEAGSHKLTPAARIQECPRAPEKY